MHKTKTWSDNFNDVIRDVIFADKELLNAMLIPESEQMDIIRFIERYFIRDPAPDALIENENVRICYGDLDGVEMGKGVVRKILFFDVYVKNEHLHDTDNDLLKFRTDTICQIIKEDLTLNRYVCNMSFSYLDDYGLYTKLVNYTRHRIVFAYTTTW